ncbi:hypothetical protein [Nocardiopsis synnemataformans]|uniref:hypothetical protein n=1 Tax=Nocardiopsis synnemataformans TaxID=61305 RepID=UPI003EBC649B
MSYDVDLRISTGGTVSHIVWNANITSNLQPMFQIALPGDGGLNSLNDAKAGDVAPAVLAAADHMDADPHTYTPLNPANGWGSYDIARKWLRELGEACQDNPLCTIDVSS